MSAFLVRSHKAVAQHCRTLLASGNLSPDQEQKLERLLREAETQIDQLVQRKAAA